VLQGVAGCCRESRRWGACMAILLFRISGVLQCAAL